MLKRLTLKHFTYLLIIITFFPLRSFSFYTTDTLYKKNDSTDSVGRNHKIATVAIAQTTVMTGAFVSINEAWYKNYPKASFHTKNDNKSWLQMDKAGHIWTTYQYSNLFTHIWRYAELNKTSSLLIGTGSALLMQSLMEILDGHSKQWGFSWGDMTANGIGAATFALQDAFIGNQVLTIKLGYTPEKYPTEHLEQRGIALYGNSFGQRLLKDYNSQTYWASLNIQSITGQNKVPSWLNIAFGYGASGLYGANYSAWVGMNDAPIPTGALDRTRSFYISPDLSFSRIRTRKQWVKSLLFFADMIKFPAPTLEYNSKEKWSFKPIFM